MTKQKVRFNEKRALEVFGILAELWKNREGVFEGELLPQEIWTLPDGIDGRDHANWFLFASLPMRGSIDSELPFKLWWVLQKKMPDIFRPEIVLKQFTSETILEALRLTLLEILEESGAPPPKDKNFGYKFAELSRHWHRDAAILAEYWGSDVRNIFHGISDFEEAFEKIDYKRNPATGFRGARRKIFSLFVIWLQEKNVIPVFPTPIPVDFHALRAIWATEIIEFMGIKPFEPKTETQKRMEAIAGRPAIRISEKITDEIAMWSQKFLQKHGISHLYVNPALWVLSRKLCKRQFQNTIRNDGQIFFSAEMLEKNPGLWPKNYKDFCARCPVENFCTGIIPNRPHSRQGLLVRSRRAKYPQTSLRFETHGRG